MIPPTCKSLRRTGLLAWEAAWAVRDGGRVWYVILRVVEVDGKLDWKIGDGVQTFKRLVGEQHLYILGHLGMQSVAAVNALRYAEHLLAANV